jgi:hypothetical protein
MSIKFIKGHEDKSNLTLETQSCYLPDILEEFKLFLLESGFGLDPKSTIEIVEHDETVVSKALLDVLNRE